MQWDHDPFFQPHRQVEIIIGIQHWEVNSKELEILVEKISEYVVQIQSRQIRHYSMQDEERYRVKWVLVPYLLRQEHKDWEGQRT